MLTTIKSKRIITLYLHKQCIKRKQRCDIRNRKKELITMFVCDTCNTLFKRKGHLNRHILEVHFQRNNPKWIYCNQCKSKFKTQARLRYHVKLKHEQNNNKQECPICFKSFNQKNFKAHFTRHLNIRKFKCSHCSLCFNFNYELSRHERIHEIQSRYEFVCKMEECGSQPFEPNKNSLQCSTRCKTERDLDFHIERNHTKEGISEKFQSETKLANFLKSRNIFFDRDWMNFLQFRNCLHIEGNKLSARPDFYLPIESNKLKCIVLIGNDEFQHRRNHCDFQRLFNIVQSLDQNEELRSLPILYFRFNPHYYVKGNQYFSVSLQDAHNLLLSALESIKQADIKPGVNLVFINYDQTKDGQLCVFSSDNENNNYASLFKDCVLKNICF